MKESYSVFVESKTGGEEHIFAENLQKMTEIDDDAYHRVASALAGAIGTSDYFNGRVNCECPDFYSTLTTTLLVYRRGDMIPEGETGRVEDIRPVWWEFSTWEPDGIKTLNDFSFAELKERLMELCGEV